MLSGPVSIDSVSIDETASVPKLLNRWVGEVGPLAKENVLYCVEKVDSFAALRVYNNFFFSLLTASNEQ